MRGILLDENIPADIELGSSLPVSHAASIGRGVSDTAIWQHALENSLVVVTKDADFSNRIMLSQAPPWVVHLRVGNMRKKELLAFLGRLWPRIEAMLPGHKLVNVFAGRIEAVRN